MKVIVYQNDAGGIVVVVPTGELPLEAVAKKDVPAGKEYRIIESDELPGERTFRNAWEWDGEKVNVSLAKAREITKARLRIEREPLLQAQDVAFQRALEDGEDTKAIVAEKKRLRDITELADSAETPEELKSLHP